MVQFEFNMDLEWISYNIALFAFFTFIFLLLCIYIFGYMELY